MSFGEPATATRENVERYLRRIFLQNADLDRPDAKGDSGANGDPGNGGGANAVAERAGRLAAARAPGLLSAYRSIGGSPLDEQARAQTTALEAELAGRGWTVRGYTAFQFTEPGVAERLAEARADGVERLCVVPLYPFCGQSTTGASLAAVRRSLDVLDWRPRFRGVSGWHHHEAYVTLRADNIRRFAHRRGLDLADPDTLLYFSAHGTPLKYLHDGNRYDRYVEEHTRAVAARLGVDDRYAVGFQNHANRGIEWTRPDNEQLIPGLSARRLLVEPISFVHEQSETLVELDRDLRELIEGQGAELHRVPVPHDDPGLIHFLADLTASLYAEDSGAAAGAAGESRGLGPCRCVEGEEIRCANGHRDLPPSPYGAGSARTA